MKTRNYANVAAALTLGIAILLSPGAQSQPLDDRVIVNMPYTTTVGHKTLPAGDYVIQRMHSTGGGGRVLLFYSDNGMKFETSAMTIPCQDINIARDTKIVLDRIGDDYYYDKVWVQGKEYGYQFVLPKEARMRRKEMAKITVPASLSTSTSTITTTTAPAVTEETTIAQTEVTPAPAPVVTQEELTVETPVEAPAEAPVIAETQPEPESLPTTANREMDQPSAAERTTMPKTAAQWMALMLGGSMMLGAGLLVLRKV